MTLLTPMTFLTPMTGSATLRAGAVRPAGTWSGATRDTVVLGFDDRHRRRMAMTGVRGTAFLLDLPDAVALRGGDALVLDDGALIEVVAAPEALLEIAAPHEAALVRIAWHLGNRHLPVQIAGRRLRIRPDHVIAAMVEGLGGTLRPIDAPFDPEGGAYASGGHADGHGHAHGHEHAHPHPHAHG
jgi:urease accessory protein